MVRSLERNRAAVSKRQVMMEKVRTRKFRP